MGRIAEEIIQEVRDRIDIVDLVGRHLTLKQSGRNHVGLCPFHNDKRASFSVNSEKNYWHCFAGCGGGSVIDFWMELNDCDFKTAVRELEAMILEPK